MCRYIFSSHSLPRRRLDIRSERKQKKVGHSQLLSISTIFFFDFFSIAHCTLLNRKRKEGMPSSYSLTVYDVHTLIEYGVGQAFKNTHWPIATG